MTEPLTRFSHRYSAALRSHLKGGSRSSLKPAAALGVRARASGKVPAELAHIHEKALLLEIPTGIPSVRRSVLIHRAAAFFAEVVASPAVPGTRGTPPDGMKALVEVLSRRAVDLVAVNRDLQGRIAAQKAKEAGLRSSRSHYARLLKQSSRMQKELRGLSRRMLSVQEEDRRRISRDLHDVIAQTLSGINVRLAALKREAAINTEGLSRNIERTQQLVEQSVDIVHQFARELRPAVLDDLGLIPALRSFLAQFRVRTGVRVHFTAAAEVETLSSVQRTVLFRVAQEAVTNVERHAAARRVRIALRRIEERICMKVSDDGKSFQVERVMQSLGGRGLGLLGMRERLEMVGGTFEVSSRAGRGTTVTACIPIVKGRAAGNGSGPRKPTGQEGAP